MYRKESAYIEKKLQTLLELGKFEEMYKFSKNIYELHDENQFYNRAISLYYQSYYQFSKGYYNDCLLNCVKCEEICMNNKFYKVLLNVNNLQGIAYSDLGDTLTSLHYLLKAYYLSLEYPEFEYQYIVLSNLGMLFNEIDCYEKGVEYHIQAFQQRRKNEKEINVNDGFILVNILMNYYKLNQEAEFIHWQDIFHFYFDNNENKKIKESKIIIDLYYHLYKNNIDEMKQCIYDFINETSYTIYFRNTIKNYINCIKICITIKLKEQAYLLYRNLEKKFPNALSMSCLSKIKFELIITFYTKEQLYLYLLESYRLNIKSIKKDRLSQLQSMMNKLYLENILYEHNIILQRNEELIKSNKLDAFTEVLNKIAFQMHVEEKLVEKNKKGALFIIDIDNFKHINDTCGHLIGDHVIIKIASILRDNIRDNDLIGRIGGDEFCIYLDNIKNVEDIDKKANYILNLIRKMKVDELCNPITISMGICFVENEEKFDNIYQKADLALYQAKENGRNQFIIFI